MIACFVHSWRQIFIQTLISTSKFLRQLTCRARCYPGRNQTHPCCGCNCWQSFHGDRSLRDQFRESAPWFESPGNSVTNKYSQVWDTPNLFVTGAAICPQNPGLNPTETLGALTYMTGDALVEQYFRDPNPLMG